MQQEKQSDNLKVSIAYPALPYKGPSLPGYGLPPRSIRPLTVYIRENPRLPWRKQLALLGPLQLA